MRKLDGKWLVGISAGPDSMALLHMCIELQMDIVCAHVNYHHRDEANEEADYVRHQCKKYGITVFVLDDSFSYTKNFEAEARNWRYDFFANIVKQQNLKGVLIAHHEDDLLETYFMQEEKQSIPAFYGLKEDFMYHGILVKRPLLSYTKQQLLNYCEAHTIQYYIDQTNYDETLTRNRIRHQIVEKMNRFERDMVLQEIRKKNAIRQERKCRVETYIRNRKIDLKLYRSLLMEDRLELLRMFLEEVYTGISKAYLQQIDCILMKQNDFIIPCKNKHIVQEEGKFFLFTLKEKYCDIYCDIQSLLKVKNQYYIVQNGEPGIYACTLFEEDFPICVRSAKVKDFIQMRYGKKKVSRFFIDRHIPKYKRIYWPVIENKKGDVIFVSGLGCDIHHFTSNPTCNVIEYTLLEENGHVGKE